VLRKISKGPIIIEMKDTQIALGRDVAESLLVDAGEKEKDKEKEKGRREGTKGAPTHVTAS